jgi:DNA-directed RNA polymerase subunit alpha
MQNDWRDLIKPKAVEFDEKESTATYGRFLAEPLERGYGTTVGNALRRILLSSLPGFAITAVRIKSVLHEFSTIPGVKEDVTDIVLNLKEVRLRLHEGDQITATLKSKGEGVVTAGDINAGPSLEVLTPGQHIATLDKGADLDMEIVIKRGRGYVTAERGGEDEPIGTIRLDAVFSPIKKVNFTVTNARVGQRTDYDRLALEIFTDGSISARDALTRREWRATRCRFLPALRKRSKLLGVRSNRARRKLVRPSTNCSIARWKDCRFQCARSMGCKMPTSSTSASWFSAPSRTCSRSRISAASRSTK